MSGVGSFCGKCDPSWGTESIFSAVRSYGLDGLGIESGWGKDFPHPFICKPSTTIRFLLWSSCVWFYMWLPVFWSTVLPLSSVLKNEVAYSSETFVIIYQTTRPHRREEHSMERTFFKNPNHYQIWFSVFPSYESFSKCLCESLCFCCCNTLMGVNFISADLSGRAA